MVTMGIFLLTLTCWLRMMISVEGQSYQEVLQLERDLFQNYSPNIRPLLDQSRTLTINASFILINFLQIDEVEQIFSVNGALALYWTDEILRWKPSDYGKMTFMFPNRMSIWLPRSMILNTATKRDIFEDDHHPLVLLYNGKVYWMPGGIFPATCKFNLRKFPFDEQTCSLTILSMYSVDKVVKYDVPSNSPISFSIYEENAGWWLISSRLHSLPGTHNGSHNLKLTLTIRRRPAFFILNILIPVNLVAALDILVFLIPVESGERIGVSLTVLLAQTVYMSITSTYLPSASDIVPLVVYFLSVLTLMAVLTVIMCILLAWLHHKEEEEQKNHNVKSAYRSVLKKIIRFPASKATEENLNSQQLDKTSQILSRRQRAEEFANQELQSTLFSPAQDHEPKTPSPYLCDKHEMDGRDAENTNTIDDTRSASVQEKGGEPNQSSQSLSSMGDSHHLSSSATTEKGKFRLMAMYLEQTCLLAFLLLYLITLSSFIIFMVI